MTKTEEEIAEEVRRLFDEVDPLEFHKYATVKDLADRFMVNRSTLSRAFTACYPGTTLQRFLEIRKIIMFELLVQFYDVKTIKEALKIMDIRNASHFIKRYKELRKQTPGETIRQHLKEKEERKKNEKKENKKPEDTVIVTK